MADTQADTVVEPANPGDQAAVVALFAEDLKALRLPVDLDALTSVYDRMMQDPRAVVLVCRERPAATPSGVLVASRMLSVKHAGRSLWIEELYVGRDARQRGYGRAMVEGLMALAASSDIRGIDLEAYHGNDAAALLYRSVGFRRLGRERFTYHFDWETDGDD